MAKLRICCNLIFVGKDELAARVFTKGSGIFSPISATFYTLNPTPSSPDIYTDVDMQITTKLGLKLFVKGHKNG